MRVYQGEPAEGSKPPSATAAAELTARVDEVVQAFALRLDSPPDEAVLTALRVDVLELAKGHAARTVLETITARASLRAAKRQRRPWNGRPQVGP
jgi:hypothetical protein